MNQPATSPGDNTFAALDLGSNSFHLLVARCEGSRLVVLDRHKENVRFASGLRPDGTLSKAMMDKALDSLRRFAQRLRSTPPGRVRVVGTNTLRKATNADSFLQRAEDILQCPIDIISGIEEARLIYLGVANDLSPGEQRRLVVDIGGGSTELVIGNRKPLKLDSLYMGCVSHSVRFFPDGLISPDCYQKAVIAARAEMQWASHDFSSAGWQEAVGSSGTIRAIEKILHEAGMAPNHTITLAGIDFLAAQISRHRQCSELDLPGLSEDRRPVLPGGLAVLHAIFLELGISEMHVSQHAIREGIILDLAGRLHDEDMRRETVQRFMRQYQVDRVQVQRVQQWAQHLLEQARDEFSDIYDNARQLLDWAICLHEIGLSVSHNGYHKHSAYLVQNSDMPGFSRQEQKLLGFLVLNHRRKLKPLPQTYGFDPDWRLVQILRLAFLFNRHRDDHQPPADLKMRLRPNGMRLQLDHDWLEAHPLTAEDLKAEQRFLKGLDLDLVIEHK